MGQLANLCGRKLLNNNYYLDWHRHQVAALKVLPHGSDAGGFGAGPACRHTNGAICAARRRMARLP
jgi:hypothetical protein